MAQAQKNGALASEYKYDFNGERVHKNTPEGIINYLIDNNNQTGYSQALRKLIRQIQNKSPTPSATT